MLSRLLVVLVAGIIAGFLFAAAAHADPTVTPDPQDPRVVIKDAQRQPPSESGSQESSDRRRNEQVAPPSAETSCRMIGDIDCSEVDVDAVLEYTAQELTVGDIREAVRRVGLPAVGVQIQPGGTTLVNLETIFYADARDFQRSVELLGFAVDLRAEPVAFTWHHGDGTSQTTRSPGHRFPDGDVTHTYQRTAAAVHPSVDVSYRVSYRIDDHGWETLPGTITARGPAGTLTIEQGRPLLTKP